MPRSAHLEVFFGEELVGTVHDTSPLAFEYAQGWLARPERMPVSVIPLLPGRQDSPAVQAFFENLLPEGELRHYIAEQKKASTLFSMLLEVAGDTAGGFVIQLPGQRPQSASYRPTSWEELAAFLSRRSAAAIDLKGEAARISLAGAQDKTSIAIFGDGRPMLPQGTSPSTHILKPDIRRLAKVWHSAVNETVVMRTAVACGLPTAEVFYEPHTRSCVVRRFDRFLRPDGSLGRLVQYDLCQLAGIVSDKKYEKEGGPGIAACSELIRAYSVQPAVDLRHFVAWVFFNLYVGNNDSHAKNLSLYRLPGRGVLLAPFYDLMCTRLYPGLSQEFAFSIGGEVRPGALTGAHVDAMARELRMRPQFVRSVAREVAQKIPPALQLAEAAVTPALPQGAQVLVGRLRNFVLSTARKTAERLL